MSCGQNDITKSPDHVNFVTLKIEKAVFLQLQYCALYYQGISHRMDLDGGRASSKTAMDEINPLRPDLNSSTLPTLHCYTHAFC